MADLFRKFGIFIQHGHQVGRSRENQKLDVALAPQGRLDLVLQRGRGSGLCLQSLKDLIIKDTVAFSLVFPCRRR